MNKKQKVAFLVGIGIMVLMGLIPPWYYYLPPWADASFFVRFPGYYGWIFSRPAGPGTHVDITRLFIQWAVVAIATAGIMWVLKDDNGRSQKGG